MTCTCAVVTIKKNKPATIQHCYPSLLRDGLVPLDGLGNSATFFVDVPALVS